jgi:hypothetical protein
MVLQTNAMLRKIMASLIVGLALVAATVQLPAATCLMTNAPSEKACRPGCCANKTCCETTPKRTELPAQPLARSGVDQQNVSAMPQIAAVVLVMPAATESHCFSSTERRAHSPRPLALLCIRLI